MWFTTEKCCGRGTLREELVALTLLKVWGKVVRQNTALLAGPKAFLLTAASHFCVKAGLSQWKPGTHPFSQVGTSTTTLIILLISITQTYFLLSSQGMPAVSQLTPLYILNPNSTAYLNSSRVKFKPTRSPNLRIFNAVCLFSIGAVLVMSWVVAALQPQTYQVSFKIHAKSAHI